MAAEKVQHIAEALERAVTSSGQRLVDLSRTSPVLLVFLRNAGCTFCREALWDLAAQRGSIDAAGTKIVIVHMGDSEGIEALLVRYKITDVERISDPEQRLYRAFGLKEGTLWQLFGPKVLWRALGEGVLRRHGIAWAAADSAQMPGLFLLDGSELVRRFRHRSAADRPNYQSLCTSKARAAGER